MGTNQEGVNSKNPAIRDRDEADWRLSFRGLKSGNLHTFARLSVLIMTPLLIAVLQLRDLNPLYLACALAIFGFLFGLAVSSFFEPPTRWAIFVVVFCFSAIWGSPIFRSYVYYDELARPFQTTSLSEFSTWLQPINDHMQPVMIPIWWAQYHQALGGSYVPISVFLYVIAVVGICGIFFFCHTLSGALGASGALVVAIVASLPLHSNDLWFWKPAGDGQILSLASMSVWLSMLAWSRGAMSIPKTLIATFLVGIAVFASSALTLVFLFAVPLLLMRPFRTLSTYINIAIAVVVSLLYWITKIQVAEVGTSSYAPEFEDLAGAFVGVWIQFGHENILLILVLSLIAVQGLLTSIGSGSSTGALFAFGITCIVVGTVQLWAARDLSLWTSRGFSGYQMLLPFLGCSVVVALGTAGLLAKLKAPLSSWKIVALIYLGIAFLSLTSPPGSGYFTQGVDVSETLEARAELFEDLRNLGRVPIPNFTMATSHRADVLHFAPRELLQPIESGGWQSWHDLVTLSSLRRLSGADYVTAPCNARDQQASTAVRDFVAKYWTSWPDCG